MSVDDLKKKKERLRENWLNKLIEKKVMNDRVKKSILNKLKMTEVEETTWVLRSSR